MRTIKSLVVRLAEVLPYTVVFLATFKFPIDTDLGWHLKQGEYFALNHRILDVNIFSSAMPGYHYINHFWLLDYLEYLIFKHSGFLGIALLGSAVWVLTFFFLARIAKLNLWQIAIVFPLILFVGSINIGFSFSAQSVSILFLAILAFFLKELYEKNWKLTFLAVLILIILWSNLHGQFILALPVIGAFALSKLANKKRDLKLVALLALSLLVAFLNPYGPLIYQVVFNHFYNPLLANISEWQSPLQISSPLLISWLEITAIASLSTLFLSYKRKLKENTFYILLTLVFLIPSVTATRYLWVAVYMSLPLIGVVIKEFKPNQLIAQRLSIAFLLILFFLVGFVSFPYKAFIYPNWKTYCTYQLCSGIAADFILEKKLNQDLFTTYELGGWLIWNYPKIKPFVDGRMTVWEEERGAKKYSAFSEMFDLEWAKKSVDDSKFNNVFIVKSKPIYDEMEKLVKEDKWSRVFEDFHTVVYVRK